MPVRVGEPAVGVLTAAYNGFRRAVLDVRRTTSAVERRLLDPDTLTEANFTDYDDWAPEGLPKLG